MQSAEKEMALLHAAAKKTTSVTRIWDVAQSACPASIVHRTRLATSSSVRTFASVLVAQTLSALLSTTCRHASATMAIRAMLEPVAMKSSETSVSALR
jgi:hypothetical protein